VVFVSPHAFRLTRWWRKHNDDIGISFRCFDTTSDLSSSSSLAAVYVMESIFSYVDTLLKENEEEAVLLAHYSGSDDAYSVHILSSLLYARCNKDANKKDVHERMIQYASFRGNTPATPRIPGDTKDQLGRELYISREQVVYNDETNYAPSKKRLDECLNVLFPTMNEK
jgi:hypothetical protein